MANPAFHGPPGAGFLPFGPFLLLVLLLLVGTVIWLVVRAVRGPSTVSRARDVLAERYARGEIDSEEYRQRRRDLG
ncbi:SHOCT domain-containing protein [Saccharopolyspora sp. HNM0983]|uniref:SHOCT domain-containing protein n=2 Tax=Saccharopolyspora montiporae TaxID=2781240 RepID=A0A929BAV2_9PSEU|nr:SHOCT domain-containing protein [Saccharopolyspora sp. HNM0983]